MITRLSTPASPSTSHIRNGHPHSIGALATRTTTRAASILPYEKGYRGGSSVVVNARRRRREGILGRADKDGKYATHAGGHGAFVEGSRVSSSRWARHRPWLSTRSPMLAHTGEAGRWISPRTPVTGCAWLPDRWTRNSLHAPDILCIEAHRRLGYRSKNSIGPRGLPWRRHHRKGARQCPLATRLLDLGLP